MYLALVLYSNPLPIHWNQWIMVESFSDSDSLLKQKQSYKNCYKRIVLISSSQNCSFSFCQGCLEKIKAASDWSVQKAIKQLACTLRRKCTQKHLLWCFSFSQIGDSCQYLEGPVSTTVILGSCWKIIWMYWLSSPI